MGDNWLTIITNTCQELLTAKGDGFVTFGLNIVTSLAVIRLVLFGIDCALGAAGMDWGGFVRHILVIGAAFTLLRGYNAPVLGTGDTFPKLVMNGPIYLAHEIGNDSFKQIEEVFKDIEQKNPPSWTVNIGPALSRWTLEMLLAVTRGIMLIIQSYGFIGAAVCALVGPIFIPFLLFEPLSFMFWNWLKTFLQYSFYPVIGAAYTHIFASVLVNAIDSTSAITALVAVIPVLLLTIIGMLHAPQMCASLFSGGGGDHAGMGSLAAKAVRGK